VFVLSGVTCGSGISERRRDVQVKHLKNSWEVLRSDGVTCKNSAISRFHLGHGGKDRNLMEPCSFPLTQVPAAFGGRDCDSVGGNLFTSQWPKSLQRLRMWGMYENVCRNVLSKFQRQNTKKAPKKAPSGPMRKSIAVWRHVRWTANGLWSP